MKKDPQKINEFLAVKSCVGCGFCCFQAKCVAGVRMFGSSTDICPALEWQETRYYCKLMQLPGDLGARYREELYSGVGCCSGLNGWRNDVQERVKRKDLNLVHLDPLFQMFLKCLGKEFISSDCLRLTCYSLMDEMEKNGWEKKQAESLVNHILSQFRQQRSRFTEGFMG